MHSSSSKSGYLFAAGAVFIWSGFVLVARMGGTSTLNSFDITALRFGVAALVFLPLWWFWKQIPLFNKTVLSLALTGGIAYSLVVYFAFKHAPAAHGAVLISGLLPFFGLVDSERTTTPQSALGTTSYSAGDNFPGGGYFFAQ